MPTLPTARAQLDLALAQVDRARDPEEMTDAELADQWADDALLLAARVRTFLTALDAAPED